MQELKWMFCQTASFKWTDSLNNSNSDSGYTANAKRILVPPRRLHFWHASLKFLRSVWRTEAVANVTYLITDSMSLPLPPCAALTSLRSNIASLGAAADHRCISLPDVSTDWNFFYPAFFFFLPGPKWSQTESRSGEDATAFDFPPSAPMDVGTFPMLVVVQEVTAVLGYSRPAFLLSRRHRCPAPGIHPRRGARVNKESVDATDWTSFPSRSDHTHFFASSATNKTWKLHTRKCFPDRPAQSWVSAGLIKS